MAGAISGRGREAGPPAQVRRCNAGYANTVHYGIRPRHREKRVSGLLGGLDHVHAAAREGYGYGEYLPTVEHAHVGNDSDLDTALHHSTLVHGHKRPDVSQRFQRLLVLLGAIL